MSRDPHAVQERTPTADGAPPIALVVLVGEPHRALLPAVLDDFRAQTGVDAELVIVDRTRAADLCAEGATLVRCASPSRGEALRAGMAATSAPLVAWQHPACRLAPERLTRQAAFLHDNPGKSLVTAGLSTIGADGAATAALDPTARRLPAFWASTVALTRQAAEDLATTAFHPVELDLYHHLRRTGAVDHLPEPLVTVDAHRSKQAREAALLDARLSASAHLQYTGARPQLSVILSTDGHRESLHGALEGLCRQDLPPGTFELIVTLPPGCSQLAHDLEALDWSVPFSTVQPSEPGLPLARNAGAKRARGRSLLFLHDDHVAQPGMVERHIHLQAARGPRRLAVMGASQRTGPALDLALHRALDGTDLLPGWRPPAADQVQPGALLHSCNLSLPAEAMARLEGFDTSLGHEACADADLGLRLEKLGLRLVYEPGAAAWHRPRLDLDTLERQQRARACAYVHLYRKHPGVLSRWLASVSHDLTSCRARLDKHAERTSVARAAAAELADLHLDLLAAVEPSSGPDPDTIVEKLGRLLRYLDQTWWWEGYLQGFEQLGVQGFMEMLRHAPVPLGRGQGQRVLLAPSREHRGRWMDAAAAWLARADKDHPSTLLVRSHPVYGLPPEQLRRDTAGLLNRARRGDGTARVEVIHVPLPASAEVRLFAAVDAWIPVGGSQEARHRGLAEELGLSIQQLPTWTADAPQQHPQLPWPLATTRPFRLLAWPQWQDEAELRLMLGDLAAPLLMDDKVCLVIRHDPDQDLSLEQASQRLRRLFVDEHGGDAQIQLLVEHQPMAASSWPQLGRAVDAVLELPSSEDPQRAAFLKALDAPRLREMEQVGAWVLELDTLVGRVPILRIPVD